MSQKVEKPSLSGQRIKTRKRDEKEKYDPVAFRDAIIQGFITAGTELDQITKYLDGAGSRLNYRRYADVLFDVLFAGGILAPGGSISQDGDSTKPTSTSVCVFTSENTTGALTAHYQVFFKLIRRYKYLDKSFQDELKKLVLFLKGFGSEERVKLAKIYGILLANGLGEATCLTGLFEEYLVKEGIAIDFATVLFTQWLELKDINHIAGSLKRASLESQLMNLLPIHKRTEENFKNHFKAAGLVAIVNFQRAKASAATKKELSNSVEQMLGEQEKVGEIIKFVKDYMDTYGIPEHEAVIIVWNSLMNCIEWNKKEELLAEQSLKHLQQNAELLSVLTTSGQSQLALMVKVQEYCYENMNFLKVFPKIIVLFYKANILSEEAILKWYKEAHSLKGKSTFLQIMKTFVDWLENAEEESDDDEEEDD